MKIVFFGTGAFGIPSLEALRNSRHELLAVVTSPDKPQGRHLLPQPSPVKTWSAKNGVACLQFSKTQLETVPAALKDCRADVFVVIAYGVILKKGLLELPKLAPLNVHGSLLPRHRGAAPVQWALWNGDKETGVTVIRMTEKLDAGDVLVQRAMAIRPEDDAPALAGRLSVLGALALVEALELLEKGRPRFLPQDDRLASYARKITKEDGRLDWNLTVEEIRNRRRALAGWPGCYFLCAGRRLIVLEIGGGPWPGGRAAPPGSVVEASPRKGLWVAAKDGSVEVKTVQPEGKKAMSAREFLRGFPVRVGAFVE